MSGMADGAADFLRQLTPTCREAAAYFAGGVAMSRLMPPDDKDASPLTILLLYFASFRNISTP